MFFCIAVGQIFPAEMIAAKWYEQKFTVAHLDNVINTQNYRTEKRGVVVINHAIGIAWQ